MAKKKNKKDYRIENVGSFDGNVKGIIITIICILCFFGAFYLLTIYITNKNNDSKEEQNENIQNETSISYSDIMLGRSFSMSDNDYFVLYYDKSDEEISGTYSQLVSSYKGKEGHLEIYTVDMSSSFNKEYATVGESNKKPTNANEILINGPTLMKISNHQVLEYVEGEEEISKYLK